MILWILLAAMAVGATSAVLIPLLVGQRPPQPRAAHDLEIYRDQLAEIERDRDRGLIGEAQVEAARTEIGRRLLAAEDALSGDGPAPRPVTRPVTRAGLAVALALTMPLAAFGLYGLQGSPNLAGRPAAERPPAAADPGPSAPARSDDMAGLVERLAEKLRRTPGDAEGWTLLARSLATLERHGEAAEAFARAAALRPEDAGLRALYGEALMAGNRGQVNAAARLAFVEALRRDAGQPRARFYLGLAALQAGDREDALARWRALAADSEPDDQWMPMLRERIAGLAGTGAPPSPPATLPGAGRGLGGEDAAAAGRMSPQDRMETIRGMVAGLAQRLAGEPDDAEGWARLARSYRVLGETEKARGALAQLARLRPDDVGALTAYAQSMLLTADGGKPPAEMAAEFAAVIGRVLELDPHNRSALWIAGLVAERTGGAEDARRYWRRLRAQLPEGSTGRADLDRRLDALDTSK